MVYLLSLSALITLGIVFAPVIPEQAANLTAQLQIMSEQIQADYFTDPVEIMGFTFDLSSYQSEIPSLDPDTWVNPDIILSAIETTSTNIGWFAVILVTTLLPATRLGQIKRLAI